MQPTKGEDDSNARGLPREVVEWLESSFDAQLVLCERSVSRREGWLVDLRGKDAHRIEGFLRLERFVDGRLKEPNAQVVRETDVVRALREREIAVPAVLAHDVGLQATLFERVSGRDDVHQLEDRERVDKIARDFMRQLARWHSIPVETLAVEGLATPKTPDEYGLAGIDDLERGYTASTKTPDPLATLTFAWLRRNVPEPPDRPVLVQGDTGPGNFLYEGDRVSAILDWECAHIGDPVEDLGHLYSRGFFHPWGETGALIDVYVEAGGSAPPSEKLHFHRVASFAKAALGSTMAVNFWSLDGPLAMLMYFSLSGERGLAESLAAAMGVEFEDGTLPEPLSGNSAPLDRPLEAIAAHIVDSELTPVLESPYLRHRAAELRDLSRYHARRERYRPGVVAQEIQELSQILGTPIRTIEEGLAGLNERIRSWDDTSVGDIARYLVRRAQRAEALASPLAGRYANPVLSPI